MKQSFLDRIATELVGKFGNDMAKALVLLPNRRSAVFLRKAISRQIDGPVLLPRMRSIQDQVEEWSGLRIIAPTDLLLRFYTVYRKVSQAPDEALTNYLRWANMFLSDVDEIDLELVNSDALFEHLLSAERIASWNVGEGGPTDLQKRHLQFVERFKPYYTELRSQLLAVGLAYRGMAYRKVVTDLDRILKCEDGNSVWFVGFNALHNSEKQIIKTFQDEGKGRSFWDADNFYLGDGAHEAGKFLRQNQRARLMNGGLDREMDDLVSLKRNIRIVAANGTTGQVSAAAKLISDLSAKDGFEPLNTAIVLNDESQLMPLLHSLPSEGHRYNITLGYPVRSAVISQFIDAIFRLHSGARKHGGRFHHLDVLRVLRHPVLAKQESKNIEEVLDRAVKSIYLHPKDLLGKDKALDAVLKSIQTTEDVLRMIQNIVELIDVESEDGVGQAVLDELKRIVTELSSLTDPETFGLEEVHLLWRQLVRSTSISFAGEPLEGIQVMGMLETRLLDFENIIMLGCNEGTLPRSSTPQTFIPFDLRKAFEMYTHLDKDAVFSYHFYRLLQRASQVDLLYDSNTDSFSKGEPSRFLQQLKIEAPDNTNVEEFKVELADKPVDFESPIAIQKGEFEMSRISEYLQKGISPSGINVYTRCELMFYFRYVLSLGEEEELAESIDHAEFGTAVHDALEKLYEPVIGEPLKIIHLKELLAKSEQQTQASFAEKTKTGQQIGGKNLLALRVAKKYVNRAIQADMDHLCQHGEESLTVLASEVRDIVDLGPFKLNGTIDRIDLTSDGTLRILDYKTGKVEAKELKLGMVEELLDASPSPKAMQLLSYALLIPEIDAQFQHVSLGIIPLRSSGEPLFLSVANTEKLDLSELESSSKPVISKLIGRIADPTTGFSQTEDLNICVTCSYSNICYR